VNRRPQVRRRIAALALLTAAVNAQAATVCPSGCDFTSIQAAIDAAAPGDIIMLGSGVTSNPC
jgi:pectin methylesterase-like acyl-CoA thioesterase